MTAPIEPANVAIGRAVRSAREAAGMSTRALAKLADVSQPLVSKVERGVTAPSVATLYRIAEALGVSPAALLPPPDLDDVHLIPAEAGERVASSDRPHSAIGRVVLADRARDLEIYEYRASTADDLDVWFEHQGDKVLFLLEGALRVDLAGRPSRSLRAGDCLVHSGEIRHRWQIEGDGDVHLLLVVTRHHESKPDQQTPGEQP
jgi:transcriptional regulator with XRE-family HTH domain